MIYPGKCKIQPSGKEESGRGKNENQDENKIEKFFLRASVGKEASAEKGGKSRQQSFVWHRAKLRPKL